MIIHEYISNGHEPYVLKVDEPGNLFGVHADLITGALGPSDKVRYLLYSPIWESPKNLFELPAPPASLWEGEKAIFSARVYPASHAIAVTENRFIVSEDRHTEGIPPTVQTIPFDQVTGVELGSAMILGWLTIRYRENDHLSSLALLYTTSTGVEHFHRAVREYRRVTDPSGGDPIEIPRQWSEIWPHVAPLQAERLKLLLLEGELPIQVIHSSPIWGAHKRGWKRVPICLVTNGILLVTQRGLLYAVDEPAPRPDVLTFGVNVSCIPPEVVKSAALLQKTVCGETLHYLCLEIGRQGVTTHLAIPLDRACFQVANKFADGFQQGGLWEPRKVGWNP